MPSTTTDRLNGLTTSVAVKPPCAAVSSTNLTLAGLQTVGGVVLASGDRVLLTSQTNSTENGIYIADTGDWTRAPDFDGALDAVQGTLVLVCNEFLDGDIYEVTTANPITFGTSSITFRLRDIPALPGDVTRYGAFGDGTDQTDELQAALNSGAKDIFIPAGEYFVSTPLDVPDGVNVRGEGVSTILRMTSTTTTPNIFKLTSREDVKIEQMALYPMNSGSLRAAVYLVTCTRVACVDVYVEATDSTGCYAIDCVTCTWTRWHFRGAQPGNQGNGYPVFLIGCRGCLISQSSAVRPRFGFTSGSNAVSSLSIYNSVTPPEETFGNIISSCHVREQDGHAFDLIDVRGNVVTGCSAEDYSGSSSHQAFQIKTESGGEDFGRMNIIANCVSRNNACGFGAQGGSYGVFSNCTAIDSATEAFRLNGSKNFVFNNCTARNFTTYGLWVSQSATSNVFNGIVLNSATAASIAIGIISAGGVNNQFDNISLVGTFAKGIEIASGATNNRFGYNIRLVENSIDDVSGNSIWPAIITTPEVNLSGAANVNGPYMHRGMIVARARFVITTTITGTPQVQCGQLGANTTIAAAQVISGSAGQTALLTQASQLLASGATMQGRVQVTGTGIGFFQYEGLPRL